MNFKQFILEDIQLIAVKKSGFAIQYIKNPSDILKKIAKEK